jgi:hypothetical protein
MDNNNHKNRYKKGLFGNYICLFQIGLFILHVFFTFWGYANNNFLWFSTWIIIALTSLICFIFVLLDTLIGWLHWNIYRKQQRSVLFFCWFFLIAIYWITPGKIFLFPVADYGAHLWVRHVSNEEKLQVWATHLLQQPPNKIPLKDQSRWLDIARLPDFVQALDCSNITINEPHHGEKYVYFMWGGHVHWWGLLVGAKSFTLVDKYPGDIEWTHRWQPGFYGFQGGSD